PLEREVTRGHGIDIGCGTDPVTPDARRFDIQDGDANTASQYVKEQFEFVYSSHCLEHMHDPRATILYWWKLVKPGGYLFVIVPDEDLYERGVFPSRFNRDHKATFTLSKARSWSPVSHNVLDLAQSLPGGELISLQLQDRGFDRRLLGFGENQPDLFIRLLANFYGKAVRFFGHQRLIRIYRILAVYFPVDQTVEPLNAQAQIQFIVKKRV
ncbi:MAG: class I SAM-dependent methyltransferase, partial [Methylacidiphilales bacterium]|nr:class I SAM-dependent methyltransferase [Candidatus Methylacidiphilales bacterium]